MELPLVSIRISCYNQEKYVRKALESAINQTYPNTEIFISDDASTDRTQEIILDVIEEHPEKEIRTFFAQENTSFAIIEKTIAACNGKYMAAFGGDDYWGETAVELYVKFMEEHEEYALACSNPEIVQECLRESPDFLEGNMSRYDLFYILFQHGNRICAPTVFVRREIWNQIGGYWFQYRQLQDYEIWLRLLQKFDAYIFERGRVPVYYRVHENNMSAGKKETRQRDINEKTYILFHTIENMEPDFFIRAFERQFIYPVEAESFCLTCEKYMVLLRASNVPVYSSVLYYFTHMGDVDFSQHIEEDYGITRKIIYELSGKAQEVVQFSDDANEDREKLKECLALVEKQNKMIEMLMGKLERTHAE